MNYEILINLFILIIKQISVGQICVTVIYIMQCLCNFALQISYCYYPIIFVLVLLALNVNIILTFIVIIRLTINQLISTIYQFTLTFLTNQNIRKNNPPATH